MKQPVDCNRIILQLSIPKIRYEMWKANNTVVHIYSISEKSVPLPKTVG